MEPRKRFLFGGIGALMPVILTIISIDLMVAFNKPEAFSALNIVGLCLRYSALFFIGGFVAYLHTDEDKPFKLFELGIAAPALITSVVAANGIVSSTETEKGASLNPAAIVFFQSGLAHAADVADKKPDQRPEPDAWKQIVDGITGRTYRPSPEVKVAIATPVASGNWVAAQGGSIPGGAVKGGAEHAPGLESLYVCRAKFNNGVHPGKVRPAFKSCHVPFGGKEHEVPAYEVLTGNYKWVSANGGIIPAGALEAGREAAASEVIYVCRADYKNGTHPGKIRAAFRGCNIPWGGRELTVKSYDVLVKSN